MVEMESRLSPVQFVWENSQGLLAARLSPDQLQGKSILLPYTNLMDEVKILLAPSTWYTIFKYEKFSIITITGVNKGETDKNLFELITHTHESLERL